MFKNKRLTKTTVCLLLLVLVIIFYTPVMCFADDEPQENNTAVSTKGPRVVVSMGDSFSSGEGIPPFYKDNTDWLAHRSEDSWPGQLELPNDMVEVFTGEGELIEEIQAEKISLKLKDYKHSFNPNAKDDDSILWYFVAASGAETKDILGQYEVEIYSGDGDLIEKIYETHGQEKTYSCCLLDSYHTVYLPPQIDVLFFLKEINIVPDYITLTLGGNDLGFERIIGEAAISYQNPNGLYLMLEEAEAKLKARNGVKDKLIDTYKAINNAAKGDTKQPCILVAGYPHLINPDIKNNALFDKTEADMINSKIDIFNQELEDAVRMCRENDHLDIWFVDVTKDFETHEAYTDNAWLNGIQIRRWQDLDQKTIFPLNKLASAFSIHPNKQGAECYAKCVQRFINWREGLVPTPSLTPTPTSTPTPAPVEIKILSKDEAVLAFRNYMIKEIIPKYYDSFDDNLRWDDLEKTDEYCTFSWERDGNICVEYTMDLTSGMTTSIEYAGTQLSRGIASEGEYDFNAWDYLDDPIQPYENNDSLELVPYININIFDAVDEIGDLKGAGYTDIDIGFKNDYIEIDASAYDSNKLIYAINIIDADCSYSVYGIRPGMSREMTIQYLAMAGAHDVYSSNRIIAHNKRIFLSMDDGNCAVLYFDDSDIVTKIIVMGNETSVGLASKEREGRF